MRYKIKVIRKREIVLYDSIGQIDFTCDTEKKYLKHIYDALIDLWLLCRNNKISMESCGCCNSIYIKDFSEKSQPGVDYPITDLLIEPDKISFTATWIEE